MSSKKVEILFFILIEIDVNINAIKSDMNPKLILLLRQYF